MVHNLFWLEQPNTDDGSKGSKMSINLAFWENPGNNYPRTKVDFNLTGRTTDNTSMPNTVLSLFDSGYVYVSGNLDVSGLIVRNFILTGASTRSVGVLASGILVVTSSDIRLKENIEPIDESETHLKLLKLEPKSYQWIDREQNGDCREIGLIAQEVKEVLPELVFENNNGMYGLHYDKVSILILQSIKQLQKQIDELKNENIQMKNEIIQLKK